jgi:hypothetical protein
LSANGATKATLHRVIRERDEEILGLRERTLTQKEAQEVLWHLQGGLHGYFTGAEYEALLGKLRRNAESP